MTVDELIDQLEDEEDIPNGKYSIYFGFCEQRVKNREKLQKFVDKAKLDDEGMLLLKELLHAIWWTGKED